MRLFAASFALLLGCATTPPPRPRAPSPLDPLAFMAGCWRAETGGGVVEERWSAPAGGTMLGTGRVLAGGRTVFFEFLRVEAEGGVAYTAMPRGERATRFALAAHGAGRARFENPAHDFPRSIEYARRADGALVTRVEGVEDGRARREVVALAPVACP